MLVVHAGGAYHTGGQEGVGRWETLLSETAEGGCASQARLWGWKTPKSTVSYPAGFWYWTEASGVALVGFVEEDFHTGLLPSVDGCYEIISTRSAVSSAKKLFIYFLWRRGQ